MHKVFAAASQGVNIADTVPDLARFTKFGDLINIIVKNAFVLAGIIAFLLIVFGGFGIIASAGDAKKMEESKKTLTGAVVGFLVIITSYFILQILATITGAPILKALFP